VSGIRPDVPSGYDLDLAAVRAASRVDDAYRGKRNISDLQSEADWLFSLVGRASHLPGVDARKVLLGELLRVVDQAVEERVSQDQAQLVASDALRRESFRREAMKLIESLAGAKQ
jgi:hypothetical protein